MGHAFQTYQTHYGERTCLLRSSRVDRGGSARFTLLCDRAVRSKVHVLPQATRTHTEEGRKGILRLGEETLPTEVLKRMYLVFHAKIFLNSKAGRGRRF